MDIKDIDVKLHSEITTETYDEGSLIEGVKIVDVPSYVAEVGDFSELVRIDDKGEFERFPGFKLAQINRTKLIYGSIKAWHLHFKQDEIWYVPPSQNLLAGLWDVREKSKTKGETMRVILGGGNSRLLYIPRGIAHGSAAFINEPINLYYFVNNKFDIKNPDEQRIRWDYLGRDFWLPEKG